MKKVDRSTGNLHYIQKVYIIKTCLFLSLLQVYKKYTPLIHKCNLNKTIA